MGVSSGALRRAPADGPESHGPQSFGQVDYAGTDARADQSGAEQRGNAEVDTTTMGCDRVPVDQKDIKRRRKMDSSHPPRHGQLRLYWRIRRPAHSLTGPVARL